MYHSQKPEKLPYESEGPGIQIYLRPKLENACSIWDPFMVDNIKKLEGVQRRSAHLFGTNTAIMIALPAY